MKFKEWYKKMEHEAFNDALYIDTPLGKIHYTDIGPKNCEVIYLAY